MMMVNDEEDDDDGCNSRYFWKMTMADRNDGWWILNSVKMR